MASRMIPKSTKVKIQFFKGFNFSDIFVILFALILVALAMTSTFELTTKLIISAVVIFITAVLFMNIETDVKENAILIKKRDKQSLNGIKATGLFGQDAIVGYFRIDPSTVYIARDEYGNITTLKKGGNTKWWVISTLLIISTVIGIVLYISAFNDVEYYKDNYYNE